MTKEVYGESTIASSDDTQLLCRWWLPEGPISDTVAVVHGLGDHSGRYVELAQALTLRGIAVYAVDLRGHGRSAGRRGHVMSFDEYDCDAQSLIDLCLDRSGMTPALLGHSMGGVVVLHHLLRHPAVVRRAVVSAPALRLRLRMAHWQVALAPTLSRIVPTFTDSNGIGPASLSSDPEVVDAYARDPLVHDRVTARTFVELDRASRQVMEHAGAIEACLLLLHGAADPVTDPEASRELYEQLKAPGSRLLVVPGMMHEPLNEVGRQAVYAEIADWLALTADR